MNLIHVQVSLILFHVNAGALLKFLGAGQSSAQDEAPSTSSAASEEMVVISSSESDREDSSDPEEQYDSPGVYVHTTLLLFMCMIYYHS